jgi:hypothetical protein
MTGVLSTGGKFAACVITGGLLAGVVDTGAVVHLELRVSLQNLKKSK